MQTTEFYPYISVENEPDRLHLRLHPNQAPLRFMLFRILPFFLLSMSCAAVAAYEDDMPWWYIPVVLMVLIPVYFLFKNKYFTRIYITKTQIKANQQGFWGSREKQIDLRDATHVLLIKQNVIRGAQAHCYVVFKAGSRQLFAQFPLLLDPHNPTYASFIVRIKSITGLEVQIEEDNLGYNSYE